MAVKVVFGELVCVFLFSFWFHSCVSYQEYSLENGKLCSLLFTKGKIKLGEKNQAALVKETRYFDNWSGESAFRCKFEVEVNSKNTLFAVIQNLSFRKDANGNCIDYVQFKRDDGEKSIKFCGHITALKPPVEGEENFNSGDNSNAANAFIDPNGEMNVDIYIAHKKLFPNESIDLKIAFTLSQECYKSPPFFSSCGGNHCINKEYFNDGIVNCPFSDCMDEDGCTSGGIHRSGEGTKVAFGAIATVLLSFILFFACIWVLRRYQKMCWSTEFSSPSSPRISQIPSPAGITGMHIPVQTVGSDDEGEVQVERNFQQPTPSAPTSDQTSVTILDDKDLPPPYESLFPSR